MESVIGNYSFVYEGNNVEWSMKPDMGLPEHLEHLKILVTCEHEFFKNCFKGSSQHMGTTFIEILRKGVLCNKSFFESMRDSLNKNISIY